jgi:hypothetical protein
VVRKASWFVTGVENWRLEKGGKASRSFPTLRVTCTVIKYCVEIVWGSGILQIDEYQLV